MYGFKCTDGNIKGNFILVESDTRFYSAPISSIVDEIKEGAYSRIWIKPETDVWTSNRNEPVTLDVTERLADFKQPGLVAALQTTGPWKVPPQYASISRQKCMFLKMCDDANQQLDVNSNLSLLQASQGYAPPLLAALMVCLGCQSEYGTAQDWMESRTNDPTEFDYVSQVIGVYGV